MSTLAPVATSAPIAHKKSDYSHPSSEEGTRRDHYHAHRCTITQVQWRWTKLASIPSLSVICWQWSFRLRKHPVCNDGGYASSQLCSGARGKVRTSRW